MAAPDFNQLFARSEAAFSGGRLDEARRMLDTLQRVWGDHEAVLHLRALVEKRSGNEAASERAFLAALKLASDDPQINNNYANLLSDSGRFDSALVHYDRALAVEPGFIDARLNRAIAIQRLGRAEEALAELDRVLLADPRIARAHSARGATLRSLGRLAAAAAAFDAALARAPSHLKALEGRARVAMEQGDTGASAHYRRALEQQPDNTKLLLGLADALEAAGDPESLDLLAKAVAKHPSWIAGHERLAEMRAEAENGADFARSYRQALDVRPRDRDLHHSHWRALSLAERFSDALIAIEEARSHLAADRDMFLMEAIFRSEVGEADTAEDIFASLGDDPAIVLARARTLFRRGDAGKAAALFEQVVATRPDDIAAWAYLGLAWRMTDDARHEWLCMQPGLYGTIELELESRQLDEVATVVRGLHRTRAHPIGQSLRGGTQTRGRLFWRTEPAIAALRRAVEDAISRFVSGLPPADPAHPLLRYRERRLEMEGSWSVRLTQSGFHINHIHPQGVLSSACYLSLPPSLGRDGGQAGWLELGAPPRELGLPLGALAMVEPRPGRLALFPSYLYHGTLPFASGERLTVAFDVVAR